MFVDILAREKTFMVRHPKVGRTGVIDNLKILLGGSEGKRAIILCILEVGDRDIARARATVFRVEQILLELRGCQARVLLRLNFEMDLSVTSFFQVAPCRLDVLVFFASVPRFARHHFLRSRGPDFEVLFDLHRQFAED